MSKNLNLHMQSQLSSDFWTEMNDMCYLNRLMRCRDYYDAMNMYCFMGAV